MKKLILEETEDSILFPLDFTYDDSYHLWENKEAITKLNEIFPYSIKVFDPPLMAKIQDYFENNYDADGFVFSKQYDRYALRKNSQWTWLLDKIYFKTPELKMIAMLL